MPKRVISKAEYERRAAQAKKICQDACRYHADMLADPERDEYATQSAVERFHRLMDVLEREYINLDLNTVQIQARSALYHGTALFDRKGSMQAFDILATGKISLRNLQGLHVFHPLFQRLVQYDCDQVLAKYLSFVKSAHPLLPKDIEMIRLMAVGGQFDRKNPIRCIALYYLVNVSERSNRQIIGIALQMLKSGVLDPKDAAKISGASLLSRLLCNSDDYHGYSPAKAKESHLKMVSVALEQATPEDALDSVKSIAMDYLKTVNDKSNASTIKEALWMLATGDVQGVDPSKISHHSTLYKALKKHQPHMFEDTSKRLKNKVQLTISKQHIVPLNGG